MFLTGRQGLPGRINEESEASVKPNLNEYVKNNGEISWVTQVRRKRKLVLTLPLTEN